MNEESLEIDSLDDEKKPARPAPKPDKKKEPETEPDSPEAETEKEETPKPDEKTEDTPEAEADEPEQEVSEEKMPARDLREAYKKTKAKVQELQPKIAKLEAELETLKKNGAEPSVIAKQLKTLQEENQELRGRLSEHDYRENPEYKEKQDRFVAEFDRARRNLAQIPVENPDGSTRKFSDDDLLALIQLPFGKDRQEANRLFGDSAEDALQYARKIRELAEDQSEWVENNKKLAGQKAQEREAHMKASQIERTKAFESANSELAEKYPFWFKPKEGDKEGNATLAAGEALTALMFSKPSAEQVKLLPKRFREDIEKNGRLSPDSQIRLHALIRSKAMNHDRIARWMKSLRQELKETKEALAQYEQSEPPTGGMTRRRTSGGTAIDDDDAEIDRLDRQNR
jgi:hypothetical protein